MTTPTTRIVLEVDEADELAFLLEQVEHWLRHAGELAREDLAAFLGGADTAYSLLPGWSTGSAPTPRCCTGR